MKKVNHRLLSIVLSVAMVSTCVPVEFSVTAYADPVDSGSTIDVKKDNVMLPLGTPVSGGDVSTTGLNLSKNTPIEATSYTAGSGSILWEPKTATVTLNNATINTSNVYALALPEKIDVTVVAEGESSLQSKCEVINHGFGATTIQGEGTVNVTSSNSLGILCNNNSLTVTGNVTVKASGPQAGIHSRGLTISGNANVTASGRNSISDIYSGGDIIVNTEGTIEAPYISSQNNFSYVKGNITGSWVWEGKTDYYENDVNSVYGNVQLSEDKTLRSATEQDGLTVTSGSTLTIPSGKTLTVESGVEVTNKGTIVNNGTIALPGETTEEQLLAMNITGTGTITVGGKPVVLIEGALYPNGGDVSTTGIDLSINTPTETIAYKAGSGYIMYNPVTKTVNLNNVTIETNNAIGLRLPSNIVSVVVQGTSSMIGSKNSLSLLGSTTIEGDGILTVTSDDFAINCNDILTIAGDVKVNASSSIACIYGVGGLIISNNANVSASGTKGTLFSSGDIMVNTTGTVTAPLIVAFKTFTHEKGTMTGSWVLEYKEDNNNNEVNSVYGSFTLSEDKILKTMSGEDGLTITSGANLTIPSGKTLTVNSGVKVTNNGTLVNNGKIILTGNSTAEDVMAVVDSIKPTGTGIIYVNEDTQYSNSGVKMIIIQDPIDLSEYHGDTINAAGFTYTGNDEEGYTLTLNNAVIQNFIKLPCGVPVKIQGNSTAIIDSIRFAEGYPCDLTFTGGVISIKEGISSGYNRDIINVTGGTKLTVNDRIFLGASGGKDGTLNVRDSGTSLKVFNEYGSAIYCDTVNVSGGAEMSVRSTEGRGISALSGGVSVTGGSRLEVGCNYGIYITDGMLNVDSTSTLITNATIAPFCIIDTTNSKSLSQVISLPGLPEGTSLTSVTGTDTNYGYNYWSLVTTGNTLGVSKENNEPVSLTNAAAGLLTFVKAKDDGGGDGDNSGDNGGNNGDNSGDKGSNNGGNSGDNNNGGSNSGNSSSNNSGSGEKSGAGTKKAPIIINRDDELDEVPKTGNTENMMLPIGILSLLSIIGAVLFRNKTKNA